VYRVQADKATLSVSWIEGVAFFYLKMSLLQKSVFVIPETVLIGNPACNELKSWMPDKSIRA